VNINVIDKSRATVTRSNILPFHTPLFPIRSQKGPSGLKWVDSYNYATHLYGEATFDPNSPWYTRESLYLETALSNGNPCYVLRVSDEIDATKSSLVVEAQIQNIDVVQYQKDADGNIILSEPYDEPIPILDNQNNPVTKPGLSIKWSIRALAANETISTISIKSVNVNGIPTTIYPIFALKSYTNGVYGNSLGFQLKRDFSNIDSTLLTRVGALLYQLCIVEQPYNSDIAQPIKTIWNENWSDVAFKEKATDPKTMQTFDFNYIIDKNYYDTTSLVSNFPFEMYPYINNIETIGTKIQTVENNTEITSPYLADIFLAKTMDNKPYDCVVIDDASIRFNENYIIYMQGGSDGDTSQERFEEVWISYLKIKPNEELANPFRFPFNAIYDTGYALKTKDAMIAFLGIRDDVIVRLSTQDMSLPPNNKSVDYSSGSYIASSLLLQPESIISGTGCCRGEIYAHVSKLNDTIKFKDWVSPTLEVLQQICTYQSTERLLGAAQASPAANLRLLNPEKFPWYLDNITQHELYWNAGINYVQWCSQVDVFFPSRRTVHQWDTSLLSDSLFVDVLVQCKRIVRTQWTRYTGISTVPLSSLFSSIKSSIERAFYERVPNGFTLVAEVYQTDAEREDGTMTHATLHLYGQLPQRTWNVDFIIERATE
jgi:hypothetical protein